MKTRWLIAVSVTCWVVLTIGFAGPISLALSLHAQAGATVSGVVQAADGPVAGAVVRVQATTYATQTDSDGTFTLSLPGGEGLFILTAWAPGYLIVRADGVTPGETDVLLILMAHSDHDNPAYDWLSAYSSGGDEPNCQNCHSDPTDPESTLPFDEWVLDAHSQSASNPRFLTMYTGTDTEGHQSPLTRYGYSRDYGRFPLRPNPAQPYAGPGYKLDFPATTGNCAACHTPAAAVNAPYSTDPTQVTGVGAEGVACDLCHKVWDVRLNPATGLPYPNMPGVLSIEFRRPPEGHQFFAGPLDDVAPGEDTYSPLQTQSQFCAACHYGVFWDAVVYNSFGEWLDSPYSDPETGQTCQDCHMPPLGAAYLARPDQGGRERDPETIYSHRMPGAQDEALLQNTVELDLDAARDGDAVSVQVTVTNTGAGHHAPTDSPLRQILLIVIAIDEEGRTLALQSGPTLPDWAGDLADLPGVYFAKILQELWTEVTPTGAYWMPTRIVEDTRLSALATGTSAYVFEASNRTQIRVEARLVFRRAYYALMQQKGWNTPDIIMESAIIDLPGVF